MENGSSTSDILRLVGVMGVCVGVAWALQILGFHAEGTPFSRLMWVMGAASIAGAGVGTILAATGLREKEATLRA